MSAGPPAVVLYEDGQVAALGPIIAVRPVWEMRVGALNLRERVALCRGLGEVRGECRDAVAAGSLLPPHPADAPALRLNARVVGPVELIERMLLDLDEGQALALGDVIVAARGKPRATSVAPEGIHLVEHPWEWVPLNAAMIVADAKTFGERGAVSRRIHGVEFSVASGRQRLLDDRALAPLGAVAGVTVIGSHAVLAGSGVSIRPSAVIDATDGPVILGAGVLVHPLSVIQGPACLGPGTIVNPGAKLREGTSAGAFCKLGGEVEESILLDLSNKQHDGFLGHAIVGSWVNLGADTNGSDLKNNYSAVKVDLGDGPVDSGHSFVGPHIGDHAKTGIDTMLTTGGVIGVSSNVYGGGFVPRFVPAFSWGGPDGLVAYRIEDALDTARAVFARRDAAFTPAVEDTLRRHFVATAELRARHGVR